ncbi:ArsR/SmtB family transcription factor [Microbacterium invictum]|uniref:DNA-binding transcriptional ArsR family regulator n=1 Tax=Microbacterium invictum TaxID=515415 RepID=A0AA40SSL4_9MICO|nr:MULTISPECIES: helix-turn-helix domain-containing protein [Microbacterium]MBB4141435.1 DNA-binding transcriptional ArsR family regulator [Microbacterium invictum]
MSETENDSAGAAEKHDETWMTTAMMKAYSHPLRRQIVRLIARREYLRAADIAEALDVPANSASFHLRVLAEAGLIVEAPEKARDRRDRVWTAQKRAQSLGGPENPVTDEALGNVVMRGFAEDHYDLVRRVVAWAPEYVSGRDVVPKGSFAQRSIRLTTAEFEQAMEKIQQVLNDASDAHEAGDAAGKHWQIDIVAADDTI